MAFDWNNYQQQGGVTGNGYVDPSQLQMQPGGYDSQVQPYQGGATPLQGAGPSVSFDPTTAPGSSPLNGGGGVAGNDMGPVFGQGNIFGQTGTGTTGLQAGGVAGSTGTPQPGGVGQVFGDGVHVDPVTGKTVSSAPGAGTQGGGGKDAFGQAWLASGGRTVQDLKNFVAAHPEYGVKLGGSKGDKVYGPDGSFWADAVMSAGTGGTGALWDTNTGGGGGGTGTLGGLGSGSFVSPIGQFTPPTEQDAMNSPGLKFALDEANRMGQNSAAAKGTLLNGRFQQALAGSNIQNALQGYGDVYNRAANTFGINFGVQTRNQDAPYQKYLSLSQLGQQAAGAS